MQEPVRILVVDDQIDVCQFLEDYLREKGFTTVALGSGAELRAWLARQLPELVLLDVGLPGEDGLSLARHIREQYDVGIIMVSGAGETLDRVVGLEVGADDYLAKPFEPRELLDREGHDIPITAMEFDLLQVFAARAIAPSAATS